MITVTDTAAQIILSYLDKREGELGSEGLGLRIRVKATGCTGFGYVMEEETKSSVVCRGLGDSIFHDKMVPIIVDAKSLAFVDGTEIDYKIEGLNEGFEFNNPQEKGKCGCGESFRVQETKLADKEDEGKLELSVRILGNEIIGFQMIVDDFKMKWMLLGLVAIGAIAYIMVSFGPQLMETFNK